MKEEEREGRREEEKRKEEELREREQRKGVKSSRNRSRCFGEKDIKDEGRSRGGGNVDGGSCSQENRDGDDTGRRGTLDKNERGGKLFVRPQVYKQHYEPMTHRGRCSGRHVGMNDANSETKASLFPGAQRASDQFVIFNASVNATRTSITHFSFGRDQSLISVPYRCILQSGAD